MRYVFGGNEPSNGILDCSSFTQEVFRQNGYTIGRTTFDQIKAGTEVSKSNLEPGDLVFFQGTYATSGPSHVGIYLGNNKFAHNSSSANGYAVGDITDAYWTEHWLSARRVASEKDVGFSGGAGIENVIPSAPETGDSAESPDMPEAKWWGNIVIVIVVVLVIIVGCVFLISGFDIL